MPNNETFPIKPSTLETIDTGFYEYIKNNLDIYTTTNKGFSKVPVLWIAPERAFQVKSDDSLRDSVGRLRLPLVTVERTTVQKDPTFKGPIQADIRPPNSKTERGPAGGAFHVVSKINQEETAKIQSIHRHRYLRKKQYNFPAERPWDTSRGGIVYDDYFVPVPTYVGITYTITLRSEYQQQMNDMVTPFITRTGQVNHFVFMKDGHKFEAFIQQDFGQDNNVSGLGEEERKFQTKVEVKVLGYLIGDGVNEPRPKVVKRQSIVKLEAVVEYALEESEDGDITIDGKCYVKKVITKVSEEDASVISRKIAGDDGESTFATEEDYEPGLGILKLGSRTTKGLFEVECPTDDSSDDSNE